jgi:hypothetical protein
MWMYVYIYLYINLSLINERWIAAWVPEGPAANGVAATGASDLCCSEPGTWIVVTLGWVSSCWPWWEDAGIYMDLPYKMD